MTRRSNVPSRYRQRRTDLGPHRGPSDVKLAPTLDSIRATETAERVKTATGFLPQTRLLVLLSVLLRPKCRICQAPRCFLRLVVSMSAKPNERYDACRGSLKCDNCVPSTRYPRGEETRTLHTEFSSFRPISAVPHQNCRHRNRKVP